MRSKKEKSRNPNAVLIGKNLKKIRKSYKMTQKKFSEFINVDTQYYGQIERGDKLLSIELLKNICSCLNIKIDDLLPINFKGTLNGGLREVYIDEINNIVSECSEKQLAVFAHFGKEILLCYID